MHQDVDERPDTQDPRISSHILCGIEQMWTFPDPGTACPASGVRTPQSTSNKRPGLGADAEPRAASKEWIRGSPISPALSIGKVRLWRFFLTRPGSIRPVCNSRAPCLS